MLDSPQISIHAPTWGATGIIRGLDHLVEISIHAPTWGATKRLACAEVILSNFNPRTHVGCDRSARMITASSRNFNPRTHVGCDGATPDVGAKILQFQSTHPRGVRRNSSTNGILSYYFNPRTHVGCDIEAAKCGKSKWISIHAPTWGATPFTGALGFILIISIHAPTWGATKVRDDYNDLLIFQSTHPRGVRQACASSTSTARGISIHAPTWGATRPSPSRTWRGSYFNPRTHVGCDVILWTLLMTR